VGSTSSARRYPPLEMGWVELRRSGKPASSEGVQGPPVGMWEGPSHGSAAVSDVALTGFLV
jgi:hypothetical protein